MDFRQLRYFVAIVENGSFRGAAERVNVAQSALSRHVQVLEDELGLMLLDRLPRGVQPTAAGSRLFERSKALIRDFEELRADLMSEAGGPRGTITIGASTTTSRLLFGRLAEAANQRFPLIRISLLEGASYFLLEGLDTGRIDLALMVNQEPSTSLVTEPLVTEVVYLICSATQPAWPKDTCDVRDLAGIPLVLFSRPSGSRMSIEAAAAKSEVPLDVRFEAASPDVVKDLVRRGLGYGLMPYSSIYQDVRAGQLSAVQFGGLELTRSFVRRADRPAFPAIIAVTELIREQFRELEEEGLFGGQLSGQDPGNRIE